MNIALIIMRKKMGFGALCDLIILLLFFLWKIQNNINMTKKFLDLSRNVFAIR